MMSKQLHFFRDGRRGPLGGRTNADLGSTDGAEVSQIPLIYPTVRVGSVRAAVWLYILCRELESASLLPPKLCAVCCVLLFSIQNLNLPTETWLSDKNGLSKRVRSC